MRSPGLAECRSDRLHQTSGGIAVAPRPPLRYARGAIWSSIRMKPAFRLIAVLGLTMLLAGCDRCGSLMELDMFLQPVKKACTDQKPAG
jgi:hypothetical protein